MKWRNNLTKTIITLGKQARHASRELSLLNTEQKNVALLAMAAALRAARETIQLANAKDLQIAKKAGISNALIDRLVLNDARIESMAQGIINISQLPDPIGKILDEQTRPNGLTIRKTRVPIGVIAAIYESRPNVTADIAALCLKTSNAVILRGGSEALHSNTAIMNALTTGLQNTAIPKNAMQLITTPDRDAVRQLVQMPNYVDLAIPRGGENLIKLLTEVSHIPIIKHYKGVCHTYVDATADINMALQICENAKCQRPGVCNAMETLLVNKHIATQFLPALVKNFNKYPVQLRGDTLACEIIPEMQLATDADWETEYLDLILAVKIVDDVQAAIDHINTFGSHHSDAIVTHCANAQQKFLQEVDSAVVYVNASTRFTDGGEFGMGAEIGISTDKLHARGPMGLEELTTYKYIVLGNGQIRS